VGTPAGYTFKGIGQGSNPTKAVLYDFEKATEEEVGMTITKDKATVSVPSLYAYSVIELK
jgi:hypothetical protein